MTPTTSAPPAPVSATTPAVPSAELVHRPGRWIDNWNAENTTQ